jgi:hypothetical protein
MDNENFRKSSLLALSILSGELKASDSPLAKCPQCHGRLVGVVNFYRCPKCGRDWCRTGHGIYIWEQHIKDDPIGEWVKWESKTRERVEFT